MQNGQGIYQVIDVESGQQIGSDFIALAVMQQNEFRTVRFQSDCRGTVVSVGIKAIGHQCTTGLLSQSDSILIIDVDDGFLFPGQGRKQFLLAGEIFFIGLYEVHLALVEVGETENVEVDVVHETGFYETGLHLHGHGRTAFLLHGPAGLLEVYLIDLVTAYFHGDIVSDDPAGSDIGSLGEMVAQALYDHFKDKTKVSFGIGTFCSNDTCEDALNIVIKLQYVNGRPVAKLSDTPGKAMCKDSSYLEYLRRSVSFRLEREKD